MKITSARDGSNKVPLDAPLPPLFRSRLSFLDGGFPGELPEGTHPRFDAITFCNIYKIRNSFIHHKHATIKKLSQRNIKMAAILQVAQALF